MEKRVASVPSQIHPVISKLPFKMERIPLKLACGEITQVLLLQHSVRLRLQRIK